ncbi:hypothetical protein ACQJBY_005506 [Aegilops geniculata]
MAAASPAPMPMISEMGRPFPSLSLSLRGDPERGEPAGSCCRQSHHVNRTSTHVYAKVFLSTRNRQYPDFACDCSPQYGHLQLSPPPVEDHHEQKVLEHAVLIRGACDSVLRQGATLQPCYSLEFLPERTTTATRQVVLLQVCCLRPRI